VPFDDDIADEVIRSSRLALPHNSIQFDAVRSSSASFVFCLSLKPGQTALSGRFCAFQHSQVMQFVFLRSYPPFELTRCVNSAKVAEFVEPKQVDEDEIDV
jgi:hypothetical protein